MKLLPDSFAMRVAWVMSLALVIFPTGSRAICGDGRLDSGVGATESCVEDGLSNTAEACDINRNATFGTSNGGCSDSCEFNSDIEFVLDYPTFTNKTNEWGFNTLSMQGMGKIVYDDDRNMSIHHDHLAPCLYTSRESDYGYRNCSDAT